MGNNPRSQLQRAWKPIAVVLLGALTAAWWVHPDRFWVLVLTLAGLAIVAGWIAQAILPFKGITETFRKPTYD
jgi:hypothetical protein